jgi:hypothetical protein
MGTNKKTNRRWHNNTWILETSAHNSSRGKVEKRYGRMIIQLLEYKNIVFNGARIFAPNYNSYIYHFLACSEVLDYWVIQG